MPALVGLPGHVTRGLPRASRCAMTASYSSGKSSPGPAPMLRPINLTDLTPTQLTRLLLTPLPQLLIDCGGQRLPHPLGVCRYVSQQLRLRGTDVWLCNVHPELRRYLHKFRLSTAFHLRGRATAAVLNGPGADRGILT